MDREVDPLAGRDGVRERRRVRLGVPARRARALVERFDIEPLSDFSAK